MSPALKPSLHFATTIKTIIGIRKVSRPNILPACLDCCPPESPSSWEDQSRFAVGRGAVVGRSGLEARGGEHALEPFEEQGLALFVGAALLVRPVGIIARVERHRLVLGIVEVLVEPGLELVLRVQERFALGLVEPIVGRLELGQGCDRIKCHRDVGLYL